MKICVSNFNSVMKDVAEELVNRGHEIVRSVIHSDCVIIWNDVLYDMISHVKLAHRFKKPVILIQHGRRGTSRYYPPFECEPISDKYCVWGERDKKAMMEIGLDEKKIEITGSAVFDYLKPRVPHKGINIVFSPEHWDHDVEENTLVAKALRKIKGVNIITKIIGGHDEKKYDNPVFSDRSKGKEHLDIVADVLSKADIVVGISESTFELMAESLDIPVVIAKIWKFKPCAGDNRYLTYKREYSDACKKVEDLKDLEKVIRQQLANPDELKAERKRVALEDGGIGLPGNALDKIIKVIETTK